MAAKKIIFALKFIDIYLDINECLQSPCSKMATCLNTEGSYLCQCNDGLTGDGKINCTGIILRCCSSTLFTLKRWEGQFAKDIAI